VRPDCHRHGSGIANSVASEKLLSGVFPPGPGDCVKLPVDTGLITTACGVSLFVLTRYCLHQIAAWHISGNRLAARGPYATDRLGRTFDAGQCTWPNAAPFSVQASSEHTGRLTQGNPGRSRTG